MAKKRDNSTVINLSIIIASVIAGAVAWFIGLLLYNLLVDTMARPVLIGLEFAVLTIVVGLVVFLVSSITGIFQQNVFSGKSDVPGALCMMLAGVAVVFLIGMLFQWIYGLNFGQDTTKATSYVFVIDDSGSMSASDPEGLRYEAIATVLEDVDEDFPFMVYSFSNDAEILREMAPKSDGIPELVGEDYGGTAIRTTLGIVLDDMENGVWDGGSDPKVILLTDGYATDIGLFRRVNSVLKRYNKAHISVSCVGLGHVDTNLMENISSATGGVFIGVEDAAELSTAMTTAARSYSSRDLLSARYTARLNALYAILRILFLAILGTLVGAIMSIAAGSSDSVGIVLFSSAITGVIGAILMELGCAAGLSDRFQWLIMWILFALTITIRKLRSGFRSVDLIQNGYDDYSDITY